MKTYARGDAAAYYAWLEHQTPEVYNVAAGFRPWELYKWQGREIYVRVVDYDPSGQLVVVQREDGATFTVVPHQIELAAIDTDELADNRLYQSA